jgi:hypothetical protein
VTASKEWNSGQDKLIHEFGVFRRDDARNSATEGVADQNEGRASKSDQDRCDQFGVLARTTCSRRRG